MKNFPSLGSLYLLREPKGNKVLLWAVIENDLNDETSTLIVVDNGSKNSIKAKLSAKWLSERETVGPILTFSGNVVVENGIEFIRPFTHSEKNEKVKRKS